MNKIYREEEKDNYSREERAKDRVTKWVRQTSVTEYAYEYICMRILGIRRASGVCVSDQRQRMRVTERSAEVWGCGLSNSILAVARGDRVRIAPCSRMRAA